MSANAEIGNRKSEIGNHPLGLVGLKTQLDTLPEGDREEVLRVTLSQLWLSHEEFRAKIEDKLFHVLHAKKHEVVG